MALLSALLLLLDHVPRFYQGDSTAYLATGQSGWIPPDRSWAYGFVARNIIAVSHHFITLTALQLFMLLAGLALIQKNLSHYGRWARIWIPLVVSLDCLNQVYSRFFLSDTIAAGFFLLLVSVVMGSLKQSSFFRLIAYAMLSLAVTFTRVAYAPIMLATLFILIAATWRPVSHSRSRDDETARFPAQAWWLRRQLSILCILTCLSVGCLAVANSRIALPALKGHVFVNKMGALYTMGVFLPALRYDDFVAVGVPMSRAEFDALHVDQLDHRELAVWGEGAPFVRWFLQDRMHMPDVYANDFQNLCGKIVHHALAHHPQTFAVTYIESLLLYFHPAEWKDHLEMEMGYNRPLPDWAANEMQDMTHVPFPTDYTKARSILPDTLSRIIGVYPFVMGLGAVLACAFLLRRRPVNQADVIAAALLASLLLAPLYSHLVKPRYVLVPELLSEWMILQAAASIFQSLRRATSKVMLLA